jgi:hypothetical protein
MPGTFERPDHQLRSGRAIALKEKAGCAWHHLKQRKDDQAAIANRVVQADPREEGLWAPARIG